MPDLALGAGDSPSGPLSPAEFLLEHNVAVLGPHSDLAPLMTYEDAPIDPRLKRAFGDAGFTSPSPIQAVSWPIVTKGADTIAVAKTGSGKTLGFLTPAFEMILREGRMPKPGMGPSCLVLAPTRELAMQIHQECEKFGRCIGIRSGVVYGGVPKGTQISCLMRMHPQIVVATPGRMNDFLQMLNPPVTTMKGASSAHPVNRQ
jgi:ATP-dependent RNA helicase DDX5/DBP2